MLEEALIRRRRAEDLSHSVHLRVAIGSLAWVLNKPDGQPLISVDATGIQFSRTHHKDRHATSSPLFQTLLTALHGRAQLRRAAHAA